MNRLLAEQIIGIANEPFISYELIRKYFRKKASEIHPDKFDTEPDKLKATKRFILLKEAYDFLLDYVNKNGSYKKIFSDNASTDDKVPNTNNIPDSQRSNFRSGKMYWYEYLSYLLIPGGIVPFFCFMMGYFAYSEMKKAYDSSIVSFFIILIQVLMVAFAFVAVVYFAIKYSLEGKIVYQILVSQIILTLIYHGICYLFRKYLEHKYLRDMTLMKFVSKFDKQ